MRCKSIRGQEATIRSTVLEFDEYGCLTRLERFEEAEPLLLNSYRAIADQPYVSATRKRESLERIVTLYEAWGKAELVERWRDQLRNAE